MGRIQFYHTVWRKHPTSGEVEPLQDVEAQVYEVIDDVEAGSTSVVFANRTGVTPATLMTNTNGVVSFWLDPGEYNVHFLDTVLPERITEFSVGVAAVSGDMAGMVETLQQSINQTGDLKCVAYTTPDEGWRLCNGDILSRTDPETSALFGRIGTSFNTGGEAGTQFRLPDLRGRVPVGADLSTGRMEVNNAIGQHDGQEAHLLTMANIPRHGHMYGNNDEISDFGYAPVLKMSNTDGWVKQEFVGALDPLGPSGFARWSDFAPTSALVSATHTGIAVDADTGEGPVDGGDGLHTEGFTNMPPYQVFNWMIKL